MAVSLKFTFYR